MRFCEYLWVFICKYFKYSQILYLHILELIARISDIFATRNHQKNCEFLWVFCCNIINTHKYYICTYCYYLFGFQTFSQHETTKKVEFLWVFICKYFKYSQIIEIMYRYLLVKFINILKYKQVFHFEFTNILKYIQVFDHGI